MYSVLLTSIGMAVRLKVNGREIRDLAPVEARPVRKALGHPPQTVRPDDTHKNEGEQLQKQ